MISTNNENRGCFQMNHFRLSKFSIQRYRDKNEEFSVLYLQNLHSLWLGGYDTSMCREMIFKVCRFHPSTVGKCVFFCSKENRGVIWDSYWLRKLRLTFSSKKAALLRDGTIPITANGPQGPSVALLKCLNKRVKEEETADKSELSWNIYKHKSYI